MLEIEVCEIKGKCPVHKVGDRIVIDDPKILLNETDALCVHALSSLLHYVLALEEGTDPVRLGLSKKEDKEHAYIQCVDPGEPYTHGGTVIFRCRRIKRRARIVEKVKPIVCKDNSWENPFGDGKAACRIVEILRWKLG